MRRRTNMRTAAGTIVLLSFAFLATAQEAQECSAPPEYPHTRLDKKFTSRQKFSSGQKVYYSCAEDFTPFRGSRSVECRDGKWSKLTLKCEKISCGNAGDLPNGNFRYEGQTFVGEKVYAECNEGYVVKGMNYMICKKSGWTGEFPSCEAEKEITCSSPAVNGSVTRSGDVSVHRLGETITFTCKPGFQLDGAQQITCGANGQWQPEPPRCIPSPDEAKESSNKPSGCDAPLAASSSNANLADKYITMTTFSSGDKVHYSCNVGYTAAGGSRTRMCDNGRWTPLRLRCERKLCGHAGEISNGQFVYTGVEFGDTATAVCDEGYILVGRATRRCLSNGWDGRLPVCEAVECPEPTETNAVRRNYEQGPYTYRNVILYQCQVGSLVGPREIVCTKNGTWSSSPPQCRVITCPPPNVPNAYWINSHKRTYQPMETIDSFRCRRGYALAGSRRITCSMEGRWWPSLPQCHPRTWRG
ncbi:complement receptor type 1 isoform X1 [Fundulus heteroclitus]|uniref:complement receptor type 1 isoform X1 n=1 Tax=Fundulus heteroclitus TaxID=8078 RepID=UPI00165BDA90|nr:complement receptor type 1 isoform X1 [Fundulus heteroclitus]